MELYDSQVGWFAAATELPAETPLYDLKRAYYASETELPVETPLYDLERAYFAARTGLDGSAPHIDLERAFLAQETELPLTTPLDDLRLAYYSLPSLPPMEVSGPWINVGADYVDVMCEVMDLCAGSFVFGPAGALGSIGGAMTYSAGARAIARSDSGLSSETEYFYVLTLTQNGHADWMVEGSFVTQAL